MQLKLFTALGIATALAAGAWALPDSPEAHAAAEKKSKKEAMKMDSKMDKQKMVDDALGAAPAHIARDAKVVMVNADGSVTTLRDGTNNFTCMPDAENTPDPDPMCADEQGWKWIMSWVKKEQKPANTEPGLIYMLKGGSDISATDPWATETEKFIASPPHVMIMWPFARESGLPTKPQKTGSWIMWEGTPYAHLMVNGNPFTSKEVSRLEEK